MNRGRPELELGPLGPWRATVTVTPLEGIAIPLSRWEIRRPETRFEVRCDWFGPTPPIFTDPLANGRADLSTEPEDVSDLVVVDELEHARAVAGRAGEKLRVGEIPDLRVLVEV